MRRIFSLLFIGSMLPILGGCAILSNNALTPPGYHYHSGEYNSAGGQSAHNIGYTYTPDINDKSLQIWQNIAAELVDQMEDSFSITDKTIYLPPHTAPSVFLNSYDYALRKELIKRGYTLAAQGTPQTPYLYYESRAARQPSDNPRLYQDIDFTLTWVENMTLVSSLTATHTLPAFYNNVKTSRHYMHDVKTLERNM